MLIGVSQLKGAFGFLQPVPQLGVTIDGKVYHYNYEIYEWFILHFNDRDENERLMTNQ